MNNTHFPCGCVERHENDELYLYPCAVHRTTGTHPTAPCTCGPPAFPFEEHDDGCPAVRLDNEAEHDELVTRLMKERERLAKLDEERIESLKWSPITITVLPEKKTFKTISPETLAREARRQQQSKALDDFHIAHQLRVSEAMKDFVKNR